MHPSTPLALKLLLWLGVIGYFTGVKRCVFLERLVGCGLFRNNGFYKAKPLQNPCRPYEALQALGSFEIPKHGAV